MSEPKKVDRRKFLYAGVGAVIIVLGGATLYFATKPAETITLVSTSTATTTVPTTTTTTVQTTSVVTTTTSATSTTPPPVKIRVRGWLDWTKPGDRQTAWKYIMESYQSKYNNTISYEIMQWNTLDTKLLTDVQAGTAPDVSLVTMLSSAMHGMAESTYDLFEFYDKLPAEQRDFPDYVIGKARVFKNRLVQMPVDNHCVVIYYRRDVFSKLGLDPNIDEHPPDTLEKLIDLWYQIKDKSNGINPITGKELYPFGQPLASQPTQYFTSWIWYYGGDLYENEKGKATYNSQAGVKALEKYIQLRDDKIVPPDHVQATGTDAYNQFGDGRLATVYTNSGHLPFIVERATPNLTDKEIGCFPFPKGAKPYSTPLLGWDVAMPKNISATTKLAAWNFIKHWSIDEQEKFISYGGSLLPLRTSLIDAPFLKFHKFSYFIKKFEDVALKLGRIPTHEHIWDLLDGLDKAIQSAVLHQKAPGDALDQAANIFNAKYY
jgi:multiple sugar transport system substrate-binding protein